MAKEAIFQGGDKVWSDWLISLLTSALVVKTSKLGGVRVHVSMDNR